MRYHAPTLRRSRRSTPGLRLWARLRPRGPGEIEPPAEATPQPTPAGPAIDVHAGTPVLPPSQARPSAGPTLILPLALFALIFPSQPLSAFPAFFAVTTFRDIPCTLRPVDARADTSRSIQAPTGTPIKTETRLGATPQRACRDCSDLRLGRLARLSLPTLAQITIKSIPAELWALAAAVVGFLTWLAKKFLFRSQKPKPEHITRAEFHREMTATRDRIGASYLALADKIEQQHNQVLTKLDSQGASFETRLDKLETSLARLEERTTARNH